MEIIMSKKISLNIPGKVRPNLLSIFHTYLIRKVKEDNARWAEYYEKRRRYRNCILSTIYGSDEYQEGMEQLRKFYGECYPNSGVNSWNDLVGDDDDDDWDEADWSEYDDYYVGDDGEIVFPNSNTSQSKNSNTQDDDPDRTLRPGEYRRSRQDMDDYWNKMSKFNERGKYKHTKHRGSRGGKKAKTIDINTPYNVNYIDDSGDAPEETIIYFYEDYHDKYSRVEFNTLYDFDEYCKEMGFAVPPYVGEQIAYAPVSHCCLNPIAKESGILEIMREETYGDMFYEACETSELSN
jgi:hypothetical protein